MPTLARTVYPCGCPEGHVLVGVPAVQQTLDKDEADALVATLAFTYQKNGLHPPGGAPEQPEAPPDGGVSDSKE